MSNKKTLEFSHKLIIEELEARQLYSAGLEVAVYEPPTYLTINTNSSEISSSDSAGLISSDAQSPPSINGSIDQVNPTLRDNWALEYNTGTIQSHSVVNEINQSQSNVLLANSLTATNLNAPETYIEDTPLLLKKIVISNTVNASVTLTLSNSTAGSLHTGTSGAVTSTYNSGSGIWQANGAVADVNTLFTNLTFTPTLNFNSNFIITTNVSDGISPTLTGSKAMTGSAVNDAPQNSVPGTQSINEDTALSFSGSNGNLISISDVDATTNPVRVTLTATNGKLTLAETAGISFTTGDGSADTTMTFTGTVNSINTALNGLYFEPNLNFNGTGNLRIVTNDLGNTGTGGAKSDTDNIAITIQAVNDAPTLSLPASLAAIEDTRMTITGISFADVDVGSFGVSVIFSLPADSGVLNWTTTAFIGSSGSGTPTVTLTGQIAAINNAIAANKLSYMPTLNLSGTKSLNVAINDKGNTGLGGNLITSDTTTIVIAPVNDAPTASNLNTSETYTEDTTLKLTGIVLYDVDCTNVTATLTLSDITAGSFNVATSGTVTSTFLAGHWTASGAIGDVNALLADLHFTPSPNYNRPFSIATSITDNWAETLQGNKTMTGIPVNDLPSGTVSIIGIPVSGQTLSVVNTLADVDGLGVIHFQWQTDGIDINGANDSSYILSSSDIGKTISVKASYTDTFGQMEFVKSEATGVVKANVVNTVKTAIIDLPVDTFYGLIKNKVSMESHIVAIIETIPPIDKSASNQNSVLPGSKINLTKHDFINAKKTVFINSDATQQPLPTTNNTELHHSTKHSTKHSSANPVYVIEMDRIFNPVEEQKLWQQIETLRHSTHENELQTINVTLITAVTLTAGFVSWLFHNKALLISLLSSMPLLKRLVKSPVSIRSK